MRRLKCCKCDDISNVESDQRCDTKEERERIHEIRNVGLCCYGHITDG